MLGSAVLVASGIAATEGLKLLLGRADDLAEGLFVFDAWTREGRLLGLTRDPACPTCAGSYEHLEGDGARPPTRLCGRDAVALAAPTAGDLDLERLAVRLAGLGELSARNAFLLRFQPAESDLALTVFRDGRAIVAGTSDEGIARSAYARFIGG